MAGDNPLIWREDFIRLCGVFNTVEPMPNEKITSEELEAERERRKRKALNGGWTPWLRITDEGVFYLIPEDNAMMSEYEVKIALDIDDDVDLSRPLLKWGCDLETFWDFLYSQAAQGSVEWSDYGNWLLEATRKPGEAGRTERQEDAILDELRKRGYDPRALPLPTRKRPGGKSEVSEALLKGRPDLFGSLKVFEKAWERLRAVKKIRDEK